MFIGRTRGSGVCCNVLLEKILLLLLPPSHVSRVQLCATPQTAVHQAPPSLGFSRQEHWSGLPFPPPMHACMLSHFSRVRLYATPWTAAHQAPLSTEFSRQLSKSSTLQWRLHCHFLLQASPLAGENLLAAHGLSLWELLKSLFLVFSSFPTISLGMDFFVAILPGDHFAF